MKFTIAYFTNRLLPKFDWFIDSLIPQIPQGVEIDLIFIDLQVDYQGQNRIDELKAIVNDRIPYRHIGPKPCVWQGKYRKTLADFFAASNARNTAFIHAESDYVLCVDDLSILMPGYIANAIHAVENKYLVLGAYKKAHNMVVENGQLISASKYDVDSRWSIGSDTGIMPAPNNVLYGCSFGLPLETALQVNGFDEAYDGMGFEDCDFGIRCSRTGIKMFYNRNMLTIESNELHNQPESNCLRRLKIAKNGEALDWFMINSLSRESSRTMTMNSPIIRALRNDKGLVYNLPDVDWVDGNPFDQMTNLDRAGNQIVAENVLKSDGKSVYWEHSSI